MGVYGRKRRHSFLCTMHVAALSIVAIGLGGCVSTSDPSNSLPGFWAGLFAALVFPYSLLANIFTPVRVYVSPNSGLLYDLGFSLGWAIWLALARKSGRDEALRSQASNLSAPKDGAIGPCSSDKTSNAHSPDSPGDFRAVHSPATCNLSSVEATSANLPYETPEGGQERTSIATSADSVDITWIGNGYRSLIQLNTMILLISLLLTVAMVNVSIFYPFKAYLHHPIDWIIFASVPCVLLIHSILVINRSRSRLFLSGSIAAYYFLLFYLAISAAKVLFLQSDAMSVLLRLLGLSGLAISAFWLVVYIRVCTTLQSKKLDSVSLTYPELQDQVELIQLASLAGKGAISSSTKPAFLMNIHAFWLWALLLSALSYIATVPPDGVVTTAGFDRVRAAISNVFAVSFVMQPITHLIAKAWWRLSARDSQMILSGDVRKPVVFLRSFREEVHQVPTGPLWLRFATFGGLGQELLEHIVEKIFTKVGPMIAIGDPRELLRPLGAARAYVSDEEWQTKIVDWIGKASIVVFMFGKGQWLSWELGQAVGGEKAKRLILMFPKPEVNQNILYEPLLKSIVDTDLGRRLNEMDLSRSLLVYCGEHGPIAVKSNNFHFIDYEIATSIAILRLEASPSRPT